MRCFLALFPDAPSRARLLALAARLPADLRRVPEENLHLTLAFLGDAPDADVDAWARTLPDLPFGGVAGRGVAWRWLPDARRARVGAVEMASDGVLEALAARVRRRLALPPDGGFLPHVTLVRVRGARAGVAPDCETGELRFERLGLYASERGPTGSLYRPLAELHARGQ